MLFETNVFINCPFDKEYKVLLHPLLFTLLYIELRPRIAETESSSNIRVEEIKKLILDSKFSIHDISRKESLKPGGLPRFNMSYELGMDIGCQSFGNEQLKSKKCLILDKDKYGYRKVLSDISGQDIKEHEDNPETMIRKVREWFVKVLDKQLPSANTIWESYIEFYTDMTKTLMGKNFSRHEIEDLSFTEYMMLAKAWIATYKISR